MENYVLAYTGGEQPQGEEAQQQALAAWVAWFDGLGESIVDSGNPFAGAATIAPDGSVNEGGASGLTGYSIVKADSLEAAVELGKGCPQLQAGGAVEVYETFRIM
jgi:hypothetical protein